MAVPTDCPQRDERLGWTGDAQAFAPTACTCSTRGLLGELAGRRGRTTRPRKGRCRASFPTSRRGAVRARSGWLGRRGDDRSLGRARGVRRHRGARRAAAEHAGAGRLPAGPPPGRRPARRRVAVRRLARPGCAGRPAARGQDLLGLPRERVLRAQRAADREGCHRGRRPEQAGGSRRSRRTWPPHLGALAGARADDPDWLRGRARAGHRAGRRRGGGRRRTGRPGAGRGRRVATGFLGTPLVLQR